MRFTLASAAVVALATQSVVANTWFGNAGKPLLLFSSIHSHISTCTKEEKPNIVKCRNEKNGLYLCRLHSHGLRQYFLKPFSATFANKRYN